MIINFKYGFKYKNFLFGWHDSKEDELYRLPSVSNNRNYDLKLLSKIKIGKQEGYRIVRDKKTINQLKELTEQINYTYVVNGYKSKDTPF